jgi:protein-tyrosine phosphatase
MAEGLLRWRVENGESEPRNWRIESAGTWATPGLSACQAACEAMYKRGISIDQHRTRCVTRELLSKFQLVLTMDDAQKSALAIEYPEFVSRMYKLTEMAGQNLGIASPREPGAQECDQLAQELSMWLVMGNASIQRLARHEMPDPTQPVCKVVPGTYLQR